MTNPDVISHSQAASVDNPFPPAARTIPIGRVPFLRLASVELRKQVDTRAGVWLLVTIAIISAGLITLPLVTGTADGLTFTNFVSAASSGQLFLLPLIGVMAATSEWSARTALTTFTLEPRRTRVNLAKLASASYLGMVLMVVTLAVAAVFNLIGIVWLDTGGSWEIDRPIILGTAFALILLVAQGIAFGLAFLSTPVAIVAYLGLPTVWSILSFAIEPLSGPAEWLDMTNTLGTLMSGLMTADAWAKLLVSVLVWIGIPLSIGLWRTARREP
ncbi:ABC transporter permease [Cryobacterium lactosi]|uniref:ABC transporter permease n=1 Tax=Cryobacterium lactosi TaxID=1259202 RepID=A0A4R9BLN2_9MICO|nr:ABC transporter permease [Cryobacterium lactosi]TFD87033.1 ABC transporter permease [Cryobacterium lactosi]